MATPINFANRPAGVTGAEMDTALVQYDSATGRFKSGDGTILPAGAFRGASVFNSANQTLTAGVWNILSFNSEEYDTDGIHDTAVNPSRLIVKPGTTQARLHVNVEGTGAGTSRRITKIIKNGTLIGASAETSSLSFKHNISTRKLDVVAGDYFEVEVYPTAAGDATTALYTFFTMEIIA